MTDTVRVAQSQTVSLFLAVQGHILWILKGARCSLLNSLGSGSVELMIIGTGGRRCGGRAA
jgi:hypothetical protein